jgi:phosphonate transport system ATP-binding protein
MLQLQQLTKRFGSTIAVDGVSFEVRRGEMVAVIGPSGAGKSTLLRLVNRLVHPSSGEIRFDGTEVTALSGRRLRAWRANCAMIFQQFGLVKRSDVITNVMHGRLNAKPLWQTLAGTFTPAERLGALARLERLGIETLALQRADTLSGGEQQRVGIAKALMQEPEVVLADEPIASLDPKSSLQVMEALRTVNREDGLTVLCNLHNVQMARDFCDRIIAMRDGCTVFDGPPDGLSPDEVREVYGMDPEHDEDTPYPAAAAPRVGAHT